MGSLIICFTVAYIIYYHLNYGKWSVNNAFTPLPAKVTPQVKALYNELSVLGMQAKLEKAISPELIMTISVPEHKVTIEIDGKNNLNNNSLSDLQRTHYSLVDGHYTIRIPNSYIKNNFPQAVSYISRIIGSNQKSLERNKVHLLHYPLTLERAS